VSRPPGGLDRGRRPRSAWAGRSSRLLAGVVIGLMAGVLGLLVVAPTASAHEFGPFAINRYAALLVGPDRVDLDYVVDYAETPTQADGDAIEADVPAACAERLAGMELLVDGEPVALSLTSSSSLRQDGDGGLTTLRIECDFGAPLDASDATRQMSFEDDNYRERVGWREILVVGDRTAIDGDVTDDSVTDRLTDFPAADENPDLASVTFAFTASDDVEPATLDRTAPGDDDGEGGDAFSDLIADADGGVLAMVTALGFAAFLGALHSLAPGHGKTVIGAYLVGTRGTKFQAFVLAVAVALSHTLGVLVLGIITYIAGAAFAPERVYPWLQGLSALIVTGIGIWLVVTAYREWRARATGAEPPHHHTLHAHGHLFDEHADQEHGDGGHAHGHAGADGAEQARALPPHVLARGTPIPTRAATPTNTTTTPTNTTVTPANTTTGTTTTTGTPTTVTTTPTTTTATPTPTVTTTPTNTTATPTTTTTGTPTTVTTTPTNTTATPTTTTTATPTTVTPTTTTTGTRTTTTTAEGGTGTGSSRTRTSTTSTSST
jgi:nickel/cobalt exporter